MATLKFNYNGTTYTVNQLTTKSTLNESNFYGCAIAAAKSSSDKTYVSMVRYDTSFKFPFIQKNTIINGTSVSGYALHYCAYSTASKNLYCGRGSSTIYKMKTVAYNATTSYTLPNSYTTSDYSDSVLNQLGCLSITAYKASNSYSTSSRYVVGPNATKTYTTGVTTYTWKGTTTIAGYLDGTTAYYVGILTKEVDDYSMLCYLGTSANSSYNEIYNANLSSTSSSPYPLTINTTPTGFSGSSHTHTFSITNWSCSSVNNNKIGSYNVFTNTHSCTANSTHTHEFGGYWASDVVSSSWEWWKYGYRYKLLKTKQNIGVLPSGSIIFTAIGQTLASSIATQIKFSANSDCVVINNNNGDGTRIDYRHTHTVKCFTANTSMNDCGYKGSGVSVPQHRHNVTFTSNKNSGTLTKNLLMWKTVKDINLKDFPSNAYLLAYNTSSLPKGWVKTPIDFGASNNTPFLVNANGSYTTSSKHNSVSTTATSGTSIGTTVSPSYYASNTRYAYITDNHTHSISATVSEANHNITNLPKCSLALVKRGSNGSAEYQYNCGYIPKGTYTMSQWNTYMNTIFGKSPTSITSNGNISKVFFMIENGTVTQNNDTKFTFTASTNKTLYMSYAYQSSWGSTKLNWCTLSGSARSDIGAISSGNGIIQLYTSSGSGYSNYPVTLSQDLYWV